MPPPTDRVAVVAPRITSTMLSLEDAIEINSFLLAEADESIIEVVCLENAFRKKRKLCEIASGTYTKKRVSFDANAILFGKHRVLPRKRGKRREKRALHGHRRHVRDTCVCS